MDRLHILSDMDNRYPRDVDLYLIRKARRTPAIMLAICAVGGTLLAVFGSLEDLPTPQFAAWLGCIVAIHLTWSVGVLSKKLEECSLELKECVQNLEALRPSQDPE